MLTKRVQGTELTTTLILASKEVQVGMLAAWKETQKHGVEFGGWIYYNHSTQSYRTNQKKGEAMGISLTPVPLYRKGEEGYEIVADWHCHPGNDVAAARPSGADIKIAKSKDYFMLVMTSKKQPKAGWKSDLLEEIQIVDDTNAEFRVWNII